MLTPEQEQRGTEALLAFRPFLQELIEERRRNPGDPWRDVLTRLIQGEGADRLTEDELIENCVFLLNAGHETTTNFIGNALATLLDWPDQRARLLADPSRHPHGGWRSSCASRAATSSATGSPRRPARSAGWRSGRASR